MKKLMLILCLLAAPVTSGCVLADLLPQVIAAATDASLVLDAIQSFVNQFFAKAPDPAAQAKVEQAIARARAAADVALRTAQASQQLTQKDIDAAFAGFKEAYDALMVLVGPMGVRETKLGEPQRMGVTADGMLSVPRPLGAK